MNGKVEVENGRAKIITWKKESYLKVAAKIQFHVQIVAIIVK